MTYQRKQKYFPLGINITKEEYENVKSTKTRKTLSAIKFKIVEFEAKANRVTQSLPDFSFGIFERRYFERTRRPDDIFPFFEEKIKKLNEHGRIGTAYSYNNAMKSIKKFRSHAGFKEIDMGFLENYETHLLLLGKSITTIGIYPVIFTGININRLV